MTHYLRAIRSTQADYGLTASSEVKSVTCYLSCLRALTHPVNGVVELDLSNPDYYKYFSRADGVRSNLSASQARRIIKSL